MPRPPRKIKAINPKGIEIVFNSLAEAAKATGCSRPGISNVATNRTHRKTHGGLQWKYMEETNDKQSKRN